MPKIDDAKHTQKIDDYLERILLLRKQITVLEGNPEARWFRWKEIEMKFRALMHMAEQKCREKYSEYFDGK